MYRWLLFFHVFCVALWLGSMAAVWVLQRRGARSGNREQLALVQETTRSIVRGIVNPSALTVLLTGILMIIQLEHRPFWLRFMEQFGGLVALATVIVLTGSLRQAAQTEGEAAQRKLVARQSVLLMGIGAAVTLVLLVVALRLA